MDTILGLVAMCQEPSTYAFFSLSGVVKFYGIVVAEILRSRRKILRLLRVFAQNFGRVFSPLKPCSAVPSHTQIINNFFSLGGRVSHP